MLQPNSRPADSTTAASAFLRANAEEPITLSINGRFDLQVLDAVSRAKLSELVDRLEAIAGIQQGLDDLEAGRVSTLDAVRSRAT